MTETTPDSLAAMAANMLPTEPPPTQKQIDDFLRCMGYRVEPTVFARDFGVPQRRRWLFVLCDPERASPRQVQGAPTEAATVASILDPPDTWPTTPLQRSGRAAPTLERADVGEFWTEGMGMREHDWARKARRPRHARATLWIGGFPAGYESFKPRGSISRHGNEPWPGDRGRSATA